MYPMGSPHSTFSTFRCSYGTRTREYIGNVYWKPLAGTETHFINYALQLRPSTIWIQHMQLECAVPIEALPETQIMRLMG